MSAGNGGGPVRQRVVRRPGRWLLVHMDAAAVAIGLSFLAGGMVGFALALFLVVL